jgi:hypothetical protein
MFNGSGNLNISSTLDISALNTEIGVETVKES